MRRLRCRDGCSLSIGTDREEAASAALCKARWHPGRAPRASASLVMTKTARGQTRVIWTVGSSHPYPAILPRYTVCTSPGLQLWLQYFQRQPQIPWLDALVRLAPDQRPPQAGQPTRARERKTPSLQLRHTRCVREAWKHLNGQGACRKVHRALCHLWLWVVASRRQKGCQGEPLIPWVEEHTQVSKKEKLEECCSKIVGSMRGKCISSLIEPLGRPWNLLPNRTDCSLCFQVTGHTRTWTAIVWRRYHRLHTCWVTGNTSFRVVVESSQELVWGVKPVGRDLACLQWTKLGQRSPHQAAASASLREHIRTPDPV